MTRGELEEEAEPIRQRAYYLLKQGSHTDPTLKAVGFPLWQADINPITSSLNAFNSPACI